MSILARQVEELPVSLASSVLVAEIATTNSTDCDCGCTLTKPVGVLYLSVASCSQADVKWTIPVRENAHLQAAIVDRTNGSIRLHLFQGNQVRTR